LPCNNLPLPKPRTAAPPQARKGPRRQITSTRNESDSDESDGVILVNQDNMSDDGNDDSSDAEMEPPLRRSMRTKQAPSRLAYDRLGHVTEQINALPIMVENVQQLPILVHKVPVILVPLYQCHIITSPFQRIMYPIVWTC
jgi:hypothetical protein